MADERIEDITGGELSAPASADKFVVLDASDGTDDVDGTAKFITWDNLFQSPTLVTPTLNSSMSGTGSFDPTSTTSKYYLDATSTTNTWAGIRLTGQRNATGPNVFIDTQSARDTTGTAAAVQDGDSLLNIKCRGYDGAGYQRTGEIECQARGTISSGSSVPGRWVVSAMNDAGTLNDIAYIDGEGEYLLVGSTPTLTNPVLGASGSRSPTGNANAVICEVDITPSGTGLSFTAFVSKCVIRGTDTSLVRAVSDQTRLLGSGTLDNYASFESRPSIEAGTTTESVGFRMLDADNSGTITTQIGFDSATLTRGGTNYHLSLGSTDVDQNLIHVGVTGDPIFSWDESQDAFSFNKNVEISSNQVAVHSENLSVFAATTSAQLAGVISDETGSGALVFATSPTLVTPVLGTPSSGNLSNCTAYEGTAIASTGEAGGTKFLREDGDGTCSWQAVAGGGDVSKVGTPVNNQIGVWTGDGTIEGDAELTWDETALLLKAPAGSAGTVTIQTAETTVVDGDILGRIDFQAPDEASGTDSVLVAGSIWSEADDTFSASVNDADLVFAAATSETAAETMRLSKADGLSLITGLAYQINGTDVLDATTLGTAVVTSSLTTVGALNSGSITSGFGAIDNGASNITTTGDITGGGILVTGDTAAGDSAALGYTATEGIIVTGQGSTNDVTIKNDADATVIGIPTGTTITEVASEIAFTERADHESTPAAGRGYLWTKNTAPSTLIFTDDAGTDTTLGAGGGSGQFPLTMSDDTITSSDLTAAVNTSYRLTISGLTAERTLVIPAGVTDGDVIEFVLITDAPATVGSELTVAGDTGVTIAWPEGDATAADDDHYRYFISGETLKLLWDETNSKWRIAPGGDGRIPMKLVMKLSTQTDGSEAATTWQAPTADGGVWTVLEEVGNCADEGNSRFSVRRTGYFDVGCRYIARANPPDGDLQGVRVTNGTTSQVSQTMNIGSASLWSSPAAAGLSEEIASGGYLEFQYRSATVDIGMAADNGNRFSALEVF